MGLHISSAMTHIPALFSSRTIRNLSSIRRTAPLDLSVADPEMIPRATAQPAGVLRVETQDRAEIAPVIRLDDPGDDSADRVVTRLQRRGRDGDREGDDGDAAHHGGHARSAQLTAGAAVSVFLPSALRIAAIRTSRPSSKRV